MLSVTSYLPIRTNSSADSIKILPLESKQSLSYFSYQYSLPGEYNVLLFQYWRRKKSPFRATSKGMESSWLLFVNTACLKVKKGTNRGSIEGKYCISRSGFYYRGWTWVLFLFRCLIEHWKSSWRTNILPKEKQTTKREGIPGNV